MKKFLTLNDGTLVSNCVASTIMLVMYLMVEVDPIPFYEFVQKCRNPGYQIESSEIREILQKKYELIDRNGNVITTKKNKPIIAYIVINLVVGGIDDMDFRWPFKEKL